MPQHAILKREKQRIRNGKDIAVVPTCNGKTTEQSSTTTILHSKFKD
jgi:hypothetical protein